MTEEEIKNHRKWAIFWGVALTLGIVLMLLSSCAAPSDGSYSSSGIENSATLTTIKSPGATFYKTTDSIEGVTCYWVPGASPTCFER